MVRTIDAALSLLGGRRFDRRGPDPGEGERGFRAGGDIAIFH